MVGIMSCLDMEELGYTPNYVSVFVGINYLYGIVLCCAIFAQ